MQDGVEDDGEGETDGTEVETGTGPRRSLTDCLPCGLGGATLLPRRDFTDEGAGPKRDLTLEGATEDEVEEDEVEEAD